MNISRDDKRKTLYKLKPRSYQIYGIFNFNTKELTYVSLDYDEVELQFEMGDYSDDFDIICFTTVVN